jgi:fermentation-respiration switch protein FrsA (DUF1100 family)
VTHRAIGEDLARLAARLGQIAVGDAEPAAAAVCRYAGALFAQIRAHHQHEDLVLWPLIAATAGQCVDLAPLTDDHLVIEAGLARAGRALAAFPAAPGLGAVALQASVSDLSCMLSEHMADEEAQILPAMRRYLAARAYRWADRQAWRTASLSSLGFRIPWLARFAGPGELSRVLAAGGWRARLLMAAARPRYARLESSAFPAGSPPLAGSPPVQVTATSQEVTMSVPVDREKVRFASGGTECAAWHYPGSSGACVVMAGGFALTKEVATDRFARRFGEAGFSVLAFEYRRLGESGGQPRLVVRIADEIADWQAAIGCATALPGVDPDRIAIWGFSASGGHVFRVAARNPWLAAAVAQTPNADGPAVLPVAARHQKPSAMLRLTGRGIADALGGLAGRPPLLVPLVGQPGTVAVVTSPDGRHGGRVLNPDGRYPDWQQAVAARSVLSLSGYRPGRDAPRITCPLLVVVCAADQTSLAGPAVRAARRAPRSEVVRLPGGHYAPFTDAHEQAVAAELSFLRQHLLPIRDEGQAQHETD